MRGEKHRRDVPRARHHRNTMPYCKCGMRSSSTGTNIARGPELEKGEPTVVCGRTTDLGRRPIPGAILDVWQASPDGLSMASLTIRTQTSQK